MIVEINCAVSLFVFFILMYLENTYFGELKSGYLYNCSRRIFSRMITAILAYELGWMYMMVSFTAWFVGFDPTSIGILITMSLCGAIVIPCEVHLRFRRKEGHRLGPDLFISRIKYDFARHGKETTIFSLNALVEESHTIEDAQVALKILLQLDNSLGELVRDVVGINQDLKDLYD